MTRLLGNALALSLWTLLVTALPAQLRVTVALQQGGVEFGQPFLIEVERAWPREHAPQPFDASTLAPLALRELASTMTAGDREFVEQRRYEAVAYSVGTLEFSPLVLRTRDASGRQHEAESAFGPLAVRSSLPEPAGAIEWPGDVRDARRGFAWPLIAGAVLLLGLLVFGLQRLRRPAAPEVSVPSGPTVAELARKEIAALALPGQQRERLEAYYLALAEIVRRFAESQLGVRAFVHTTEELIAVVPTGGDPLQHCLFACDLVKFAADRPAPGADVEAKARALAFVAAYDDSTVDVVGEPAEVPSAGQGAR